MGGYGEMMRSLQRHSMLTWTEKGERLDVEMHSINLFSDAYTRQVEALTQKSPLRRFIQSTHSGGSKWQPGVPESSFLSCVATCSGNWNVLPIERLASDVFPTFHANTPDEKRFSKKHVSQCSRLRAISHV
jgi:hypothetical protein